MHCAGRLWMDAETGAMGIPLETITGRRGFEVAS
jgi:hypothetical protein